jgi:hypothetical protein
MENSTMVFKNFKTELQYELAIPFLDIYNKMIYMYTHVHNSIIHNVPKVETTQGSIDG